MISTTAQIVEVILMRINPGDDILLGIRECVEKHAIRNGLILTGFGSVRRSHFHVVTTTELPPRNAFMKSDQALDVCSLGGYIIDGRVHCHIDFSDERNGFGGHLEEGNLALTFVNLAIGRLSDVKLSKWDSSTPEDQL